MEISEMNWNHSKQFLNKLFKIEWVGFLSNFEQAE